VQWLRKLRNLIVALRKMCRAKTIIILSVSLALSEQDDCGEHTKINGITTYIKSSSVPSSSWFLPD